MINGFMEQDHLEGSFKAFPVGYHLLLGVQRKLGGFIWKRFYRGGHC